MFDSIVDDTIVMTYSYWLVIILFSLTYSSLSNMILQSVSINSPLLADLSYLKSFLTQLFVNWFTSLFVKSFSLSPKAMYLIYLLLILIVNFVLLLFIIKFI